MICAGARQVNVLYIGMNSKQKVSETRQLINVRMSVKSKFTDNHLNGHLHTDIIVTLAVKPYICLTTAA